MSAQQQESVAPTIKSFLFVKHPRKHWAVAAEPHPFDAGSYFLLRYIVYSVRYIYTAEYI